MHTRRDVFKLVFGAVAAAAVPELALGSSFTPTAAVLAPDGDLLPLDGSWFDARDFPELADYFDSAIDDYSRKHNYATYSIHGDKPARDGHLVQLQLAPPYAQRSGLDVEGRQIWKTTTCYIRAKPDPSRKIETFVGNLVEVIGYTLNPTPDMVT